MPPPRLALRHPGAHPVAGTWRRDGLPLRVPMIARLLAFWHRWRFLSRVWIAAGGDAGEAARILRRLETDHE